MLPYSREVLFSLFGEVNTRFAVPQAFAFVASLYVVFRILRSDSNSERLPIALLGGLWAGIAYFFYYQVFGALDFLAPVYALLSVVQSIALVATASIPIRHRNRNRLAAKTPLPFVILALAWPLIDWIAGPGWPQVRLLGLHFVPVLFLTLAVLFQRSRRFALGLSIIPLLLAGVGAYQAFALGLYQDWLPIVAWLGFAVFTLKRKRHPQG